MVYPVSWSCPSCGSVNANVMKCSVCSYSPPAESGSLGAQARVNTLLKERVIAFLIDTAFLVGFALFFSVGSAVSLSFSFGKGFDVLFPLFAVPIVILVLVFHPLYFFVFEARYGRTYGKRLMHIKVVSESGALTWSLSFKRNVTRFIEALTLYIMSIVMIKANGKRWGDRVSGTYVVRD